MDNNSRITGLLKRQYLIFKVNFNRQDESSVSRLFNFIWWILAHCKRKKETFSLSNKRQIGVVYCEYNHGVVVVRCNTMLATPLVVIQLECIL